MGIIVLFLYQTLDITKKSNSFFNSKLKVQEKKIKIKSIMFKDILNKISNNSEKIKDDSRGMQY